MGQQSAPSTKAKPAPSIPKPHHSSDGDSINDEIEEELLNSAQDESIAEEVIDVVESYQSSSSAFDDLKKR